MNVDDELMGNVTRLCLTEERDEEDREKLCAILVAWLRRQANTMLLSEMTPSLEHYRLLDLADDLERSK